ncbi:hypothetical protein MRX96_033143 [Rhipicephalus microplus]
MDVLQYFYRHSSSACCTLLHTWDYHSGCLFFPGGELHLELKEPSSQLQYDVSLVTGKIRSLGVEEKGNGEGSNSGGTLVAKEGTVAVPKIHMAAAGAECPS